MKKLSRILTPLFFVGLSATIVSATAFARAAQSPAFARKNALILQDKSVDEIVKTAFELYKQEKFDEALAKCMQAVEKSPKDFRPHFIAGLIYLSQWKLKSASDEFANAISLKPNDKRFYLLKAEADYLRNAREEALAASRKALEIDPSFAEAHLSVGKILIYDEKRRDEAIAAYKSALKLKPELLPVYEGLGQTLIAAKDEKSAEEIFRQGMPLEKNANKIRFALGRLLVKQNRLAEARQIWEGRTADEDRTFPNFITLLERAEKLQQATDALAQKPNDPNTLVEMGFAVMNGDSWVVDGRQERAIEYFKKALAINPNFAKAQYGICKAYIEIADTFKSKTKNVDEELAKLRKLDAKLANEMEEYKKNYSGGLKAAPSKINQ